MATRLAARERGAIFEKTKRMNIPIILAGLACLPATYSQTRGGSLLVSIVYICLLVTAALFINYRMKIQNYRNYMSFILGALVSDVVFFIYWGMKYGNNDGYGVGFNFQMILVEFIAISLVGCTSIPVLTQIMKHISRKST